MRTFRGIVVSSIVVALLGIAADPADAQGSIHRLGEEPLSPAAAARLAELQQEASAPFTARRSATTGAVRILSGGRLDADSADRTEAAASFLRRYHDLFALPPSLAPSMSTRGNRVSASYSHDGTPIVGVEAVVTFDLQGRITGARSTVAGPLRPLGRFVIQDDVAENSARLAADRDRATRGRTAIGRWTPSRSRRVWSAGPDGLTPTVTVTLIGDRPGEVLDVEVDARDGAARRVLNRVRRGVGDYPHFGQFVPFLTKSAKGSVFKSVDDAIWGIPSTKSLKNWSKGVPAPADVAMGALTGMYADLWDANEDHVFEESGDFRYDPDFDEAWFDQANTYYQIDTFATHLAKNLKIELASGFSLPVVVNYENPDANAFFSPEPFELNGVVIGHVDGYLQFDDPDPLGDPWQDVSRDPSTVAHEYAHAWLYFEEAMGDDPEDWPTWAGDEAFADFFATAWLDETVMFRYELELYGVDDFARDLQDDDFFIDTVLDAIDLNGNGMPEPHLAGEVLGSFLTDLRLELGTKKAEQLFYDAIPFLPTSMTELGYFDVNPANAIDATGDYFAEVAFALFDAALDEKQEAAVVGFATGRGILGDDYSTTDVVLDLAAFKKGKITIPGRFDEFDPEQSYYFSAPAGSTLSVTIKADKYGVLPDFEIFDADTGDPFVVFETKERKYTSGDRNVSQKGIELLLDSDATYEIVVYDDGFGGGYTLTLDL